MSGEDQGPSHRRAVPRPSDFRFGKEIGQGSFSNVYVVREIASNAEFAMKVVEKQHVVRNKAVESVHMEKAVLTRVNHVFIIRLHYTFQDASRLFFVLEYARGGELLTHLNRLTSFDLPCSRFYAAEILVALNYLHTQSIVHRDVKPENVLLTETMHIKLADFGSAIILNDPKVKAPGFTGTPEYVSPEMLSSRSFVDESSLASSHSYPFEDMAYLMDYWAFGCVLYQFISGRPPFRTEKHHHAYDIFGQILGLSYKFLDGFDTVAQDLVQKLLVINPLDRLGSPTNGGPAAVQKHPFFSGIDWDSLPNQPAPILLPNLQPIAPSDWDSLPAGFDEGQMYLLSCEFASAVTPIPETERNRLLSAQERQNPYHRFVRNRLILKQGVLFKRRGLFARKRMFLLTEGPHLFYVDMDAMSLKGEVPWSSFLTLELKSDKLFFIRIPNRTFYLEDPSGKAAAWVAQLSAVKQAYYAEPSCGIDSVLSTQSGKVTEDCAAVVQTHLFRDAVCRGLSGSDHSNMITWWAYFSRVFMGVGMPIGDNERIRGGFYRGSRFLEPLAEFMHVPLDQINFVVSGLLSIVLGLYLMRRRYAPENVTPRVRAVIESILGLFLLYFCFGNQLRVLLLQSTVAYILMLFLPQSRLMAVVVTLWVMFYMTLVHLCRWQYDYGGYTLDISGPVMVQTQRLSSLAFNLADGFVLRELERRVATKQAAVATTTAPGKVEPPSNSVSPGEMNPIDYAQASMQSFKSMLVRRLKSFTDAPSRRLSEHPASINGVSVQTYLNRLLARTTQSSPQHHSSTQTDLVTRMSSTQIEHAVYTVPGPVEFFAYNLYFHGACVGPFVFFSEYQAYLEGYQKRSLPRINWRYVYLVFVRTTVVGLLSAYLSPYFPFDHVLSDAFAKSPLLERILYTTVSLFLVRQKYYFAWGLSELGGISAGLGYTGICPNTGCPQYAGVRNFDLFQIECGLGLKNVIDSWNISTTRWLREVFYERLPYFCRTFLVFIISAFWHGFYPGYYLMFVTFALFTFVSRMWRRAMRPFCRQTVLSSYIYDIFTAILTNLVINYAQAPFHLLGWSASLIFWSAFNFVPHLSAFLLLFVHFIRPRLMRSVRSGRHRFPFSHGRTVGG